MISRGAVREYAAGSLWVWPSAAAVFALCAGWAASTIELGRNSRWAAVAFQGTADDARSLLNAITSTVVTVIALVLGLTVVALQLSSTQFSPRLLRNFIRDRPTQVVLSVFAATFVYTAAGLYTVGVASGERTEVYPRLAVSGAIVLLFATLAMVVFFADHLVHSIQIDAITKRVERGALEVVHDKLGTTEQVTPQPPTWAVPVLASESGYIQRVDLPRLMSLALAHGIVLRLGRRVGEHVVAGTPLAHLWRHNAADPLPKAAAVQHELNKAVRIGFERTLEQDAAFGIRQLVDVACKALSPAVNDPYTAMQSIDHLSVLFCALAARPLGDYVAGEPAGAGMVIVPGRRFEDYLSRMCGLIRRYGAKEPTVDVALLQLLNQCTLVVGNQPERLAAIAAEGQLIQDDATREIRQPRDVEPVRVAAEALHAAIGVHPLTPGGLRPAG